MKGLGSAFMALGAVLILLAALLLGENHREAEEGRMAASEIVSEVHLRMEERPPEALPEAPTLPEDKRLPVEEVEGYGYVGSLSIPVLELELPIMDDWSYARLRKAPCRQVGDTARELVIAGHNYDSHFGRLHTLTEGDRLFFTDMDGDVTGYEVADVETIRPYQGDLVFEGGWDLVLYTCTYGGKSRVMVGCLAIPPGL